MTHPGTEELTEFLYQELPPQRQQAVAEHLENCCECRARLAGWQQTRQELAGWRLSASVSPMRRGIRWVRPGLAAALLLGAGFWLSRVVSPSPDTSQLRAELHSELEKTLNATLAEYASRESGERQQLQRSLTEAMTRFEARQGTEQTALRQDVETVAMRTQEEFDRIERSGATPSALSNP